VPFLNVSPKPIARGLINFVSSECASMRGDIRHTHFALFRCFSWAAGAICKDAITSLKELKVSSVRVDCRNNQHSFAKAMPRHVTLQVTAGLFHYTPLPQSFTPRCVTDN